MTAKVGTPWSDDENDAIVADYFDMLQADLSGQDFTKTVHNRGLQRTIGRGEKSIEYKHQNISAVLVGFGETWLRGYPPAFRYQRSLEDAVDRWMAAHRAAHKVEWVERAPGRTDSAEISGILSVLPPPTHSNAPPPVELNQAMATALRFDVAGRDERNRVLGRAGEEMVMRHERLSLAAAGRDDLARQVRWISDEVGDGAGYDIASFEPDGRSRLIEVKTTNGWDRTPFHISANELAVASDRRDEWCLFRLWDFSRTPRAFQIHPPLDAHVALTPTSFRAAFH